MKSYISSLGDEKKATEYIAGLDDDNIKLGLIEEIKDRNNRNIIFQSIKKHISPNIEDYVILCQQMIRELFEDALGDEFDERKRIRMETTFAKTIVESKELDDERAGFSDLNFNTIVINSKDIRNANVMLGTIIHEFGHIFIGYDSRFESVLASTELSEGSCNLLADLAINHFINKHKDIIINGRKVKVDYPFHMISGYHYEDGWQRAILAGLKNKGKNPIQAFSEFLLGDKRKYEKMCLGRFPNLEDPFEGIECKPTVDELFKSPNLSFEEIDPRSVYYFRNWIFPLFKMKENEPNAIDLRIPDWEVIAMRYIEARKIYNMNDEEMQDFANFFFPAVVRKDEGKCDSFIFKQLSKLSDEEKTKYSFEILYNLHRLIKKDKYISNELEVELGELIENEMQSVTRLPGQEVMKRYKKLIPYYLGIGNEYTYNGNTNLIANIKNLQQIYLDEIFHKMQNGDIAQILAGLKDENSDEVFMDDEISMILSQFGISVSTNKRLPTKDAKGINKNGVSFGMMMDK